MAAAAPTSLDFDTKKVYDEKAQAYAQSVLAPWRVYVEQYTLLSIASELTCPAGLAGKRVLDAATGDGRYARLFAAAGAASVTGVDLSPGMIELARAANADSSAPLRFAVADATSEAEMDAALPEEQGTYDFVFAAFLLHYAENTDKLQAMCTNLSRFLRPGGKLLTIIVKPGGWVPPAFVTRKHGVIATRDADGKAVRAHLLNAAGEATVVLKNYVHSWEDYLACLEKAALQDVHVHPPKVDPASPYEPAYFDEFLAEWWYSIISATKAG